MTMKNPPHPGGVVLRQCIEPLGLTITDAETDEIDQIVKTRYGKFAEAGGKREAC